MNCTRNIWRIFAITYLIFCYYFPNVRRRHAALRYTAAGSDRKIFTDGGGKRITPRSDSDGRSASENHSYDVGETRKNNFVAQVENGASSYCVFGERTRRIRAC